MHIDVYVIHVNRFRVLWRILYKEEGNISTSGRNGRIKVQVDDNGRAFVVFRGIHKFRCFSEKSGTPSREHLPWLGYEQRAERNCELCAGGDKSGAAVLSVPGGGHA